MNLLPRRRLFRWGLAAVLVAMVLAGAWLWRYWQRQEFIAEVERLGGFIRQWPDDKLQRWGFLLFRRRGFTNVSLDNCGVTDDWLARHCGGLSQWPSVNIGITNSNVTDEGLAHLAGMTNIEALGLSGTNVTDAGLQHLAQIRGLQRLSLNEMRVTDAGMRHIAQVKGLQAVILSHTQLTDEGLKQLGQLPNLRHLTIKGTLVTPEGLYQFRLMTKGRCLVDGP